MTVLLVVHFWSLIMYPWKYWIDLEYVSSVMSLQTKVILGFKMTLWHKFQLWAEGASQTKVLWCHVPAMDFSKFIKKVMFAEERIVGVGLHHIIVSCHRAPAGGPAYFCNKLLGFVHGREIRFLVGSFHDFSSLLPDISLYCSLLPLCPSCSTALSRPGNCSNG